MVFTSEHTKELKLNPTHMLRECLGGIWVRVIDLEVRLIRRFSSRIEDDYDEASPVISVFSPPIKLSLLLDADAV